MEFGERLRELRKEKKLTSKQFGEKFKLAESTISGYETGARKPDIELVKAFANFFDVTTDYLLGESSEKKPRKDKINSAFHDYENITDEEKDYLDMQLEIYRKMKEKNK
ncbi:helix-turn-helix domain-containing protein [Cytobacillus oceanisediminis]|uniref:helix-turn-helix domain-containing protein n=1 Tax=Cytobacillus oceanisediminis TaxID=665099 RepID=UPI00207A8060|nr:helix-turn-helix transcriptional regulator [Cytobacillus oceanisediminis]USK43760.1 helix-turn-helix domain-containing protein [Cytobacillus oceanisediminis]